MTEIKKRMIHHTKTWYDYKMACVGTLMDNGLTYQSRKELGENGFRLYKGKNIAYEGCMKNWEDFYENNLIDVIDFVKQLESDGLIA